MRGAVKTCGVLPIFAGTHKSSHRTWDGHADVALTGPSGPGQETRGRPEPRRCATSTCDATHARAGTPPGAQGLHSCGRTRHERRGGRRALRLRHQVRMCHSRQASSDGRKTCISASRITSSRMCHAVLPRTRAGKTSLRRRCMRTRRLVVLQHSCFLTAQTSIQAAAAMPHNRKPFPN